MLNSDLMVYRIPLPIYPTYRILSKNPQKGFTKITVMIAIDEKEEEAIDNIEKKSIVFHRSDRDFSVEMKDIYCYGEVNFKDKETVDNISKFKFLDYLDNVGIPVQSNYDYETHSCSSPIKRCMWSESWSPLHVVKLAHAYLGKPKRILLFNQNVK